MTAWQYAGTGHATTAEHQLALAAAARAREHDRIAREETLDELTIRKEPTAWKSCLPAPRGRPVLGISKTASTG